MKNLLDAMIEKLEQLRTNIEPTYLLDTHGDMLRIAQTCIDIVCEEELAEGMTNG